MAEKVWFVTGASKGFGIEVTPVEPACYTTDRSGPSARHSQEIAVYGPVRRQRAYTGKSRTMGNPDATAVLQIVDAERPPLRFLLGSDGLPIIRKDYESRLAVWGAWNAVSSAAQ